MGGHHPAVRGTAPARPAASCRPPILALARGQNVSTFQPSLSIPVSRDYGSEDCAAQPFGAISHWDGVLEGLS